MALNWSAVAVFWLFVATCVELGVTQNEVHTEKCDDDLTTLDNIPKKEGCTEMCVASGDPHISTFDCVKFEYHGTCSYTLVKNCMDSSDDFEIIGEFHRMKYNDKFSVIKKLLISYKGVNIELYESFKLTIDGSELTSPASTLPGISMNRYCNALVVELDNGITIYWSRPNRAVIKIDPNASADLSGTLCGLCGNNNGIKYDDLATPDNVLLSNAVDVGDSWRTETECNLCDDCQNAICGNNFENSLQAQDLCGFFNNDIVSCGDYTGENLYEQCINVLCATLPEIDRVCQLVNLYIEACEDNGKKARLHLNGVCKDGCHANRHFIPYGSSWTPDDCSETCLCEIDGMTCNELQCHESATCTPDDQGSHSCICNAPEYSGDGLTCEATWSDWSEWGPCSVTCEDGMKYRSRTCSVEGACLGPIDDATTCNLQACPSWSLWGAWSSCSETCGGGTKSRTRTCEGTGTCPGENIESQTCNTQACPTWSNWSAWSACSVTCANGLKYRSRTCSVTGACDGASDETSTCSLQACPTWSTWGGWGSCSKPCGGGTRYRSRTCQGTGSCPGSSTSSQACNTHFCPYWGNWGSWGGCNRDCGGGTQYRYRTCYGGSCPGSSSSSRSCNNHDCPGCFAANSLVRTKTFHDGAECISTKKLSDLVIGEKVESYDPDTQAVTYSEVYFITHQYDNYTAGLLKLVYGVEGGEEHSISLHPKHLLYACINQSPLGYDGSCSKPPSNPVTADSVSVGDMLWLRNDGEKFIAMPVLSIDYWFNNVRHPMTFNHFIVVDGALASVHMHDEVMYRKATAPLRFAYNISPSIVDTWIVNELVGMWDLVEMHILSDNPKNHGSSEDHVSSVNDGPGVVCANSPYSYVWPFGRK